jgi:UDP-N-acetylmuramoyl-tripeptide--D-alanyl-D-alanine ligase
MSWNSKAADDMNTMPWSVKDILQATAGVLIQGDPDGQFSGLSIDSRRIAGDELFVAIKGEHHDGHDFIADVTDAGIRGILVEKHRLDKGFADRYAGRGLICIGVEDTRRALGDLGGFRRRHAAVKIVAITGSNGKTTTR